MSFDLDDPLGDLLSDGSNDSFFANVPKKKVENEAQPAQGKTKMDELFGIKEPEVPKSTKVEATATSSVTKPTTPKPKTPLTRKPTFDKGDDDLLSDLGFDPKRPKSSKSNVLEDILGISETKPVVRPKTAVAPTAKEESPRPRTVPREEITPKPTPKMSRQSTITSETTTTTASENTVYIPARRQTRRQSSLMNMDPLGLFNKKDENVEEPKPKTIEDKPQPAPRSEPEIRPMDNRANMLTTSAMETEQSISVLQQQEVQLSIASQMRSQETALLDMQQRQRVLLKQQEEQFNNLIQKQLQRQQQLEESVKAQQERISAHIQLLMSPALAHFDAQIHPQNSQDSDESENKTETNFRIEVKQLELEKLRLEDLISNVNANHEQEILFMDQSHKKQIQVLEDSLTKTEERLKSENKSLQDFYFGKISDLENEKQHVMEDSKVKLKELKEQYELTISESKKRYHDDMESMERNYKDMINSIRQSKFVEFAVVQENSSYLDTLKSAFQTMENANEGLNEVRDFLQSKIDGVYEVKEAQIAAREKKAENLEKMLSKSKETQEDERKQMLELIKTLEMKLNTLEQETKEENWKIQQKQIALDVDKSSFEREKEFIREQLSREQKRIDDLKHLQTIEYERLIKQLEDDRMNLITEKAKMETNLRLNKRSDNTLSRSEIEAAIKVAEDAERQADIERERLLDIQRQYEQKKRNLIDIENTLRSKEIEMEEAIKLAGAKEKLAEKAVESAKLMEKNILMKLQVLQRHSQELKERENDISRAKMDLSKERVELDVLRKRNYENRCSLCKLGARSQELTNLVMGEMDFKDNIDTEIDESLSRLRADASTFQTNLENIPNLAETSDNLLDPDLLLLKFDVLNSMQQPQ